MERGFVARPGRRLRFPMRNDGLAQSAPGGRSCSVRYWAFHLYMRTEMVKSCKKSSKIFWRRPEGPMTPFRRTAKIVFFPPLVWVRCLPRVRRRTCIGSLVEGPSCGWPFGHSRAPPSPLAGERHATILTRNWMEVWKTAAPSWYQHRCGRGQPRSGGRSAGVRTGCITRRHIAAGISSLRSGLLATGR